MRRIKIRRSTVVLFAFWLLANGIAFGIFLSVRETANQVQKNMESLGAPLP